LEKVQIKENFANQCSHRHCYIDFEAVQICHSLVLAHHHTSICTLLFILYKYLWLVKIVLDDAQVLSQQQMEKRGEISASFIKMMSDKGRSFLFSIISINESAVPRHTKEPKPQSK
jgi:hypothetical protein